MQQSKGKGKFHTFYRYFLLVLFHEGFAKQPKDRKLDADLVGLLGDVPYLNGGLFEVHQLEELYPKIDIPDEAFENLFAFFDEWDWTLDTRPLRNDKEINPDVLGYIFEKYINQKEMGAYYTKEDITEYVSKNTVLPHLFDAAEKKCAVAFQANSALWRLLQDDPDRYIYPAVRQGVIDERGEVIPESTLPEFVQNGMRDPKARMFNKQYNLSQAFIADGNGNNLGLPTETWREYVARRQRCLELREKLQDGAIHQINDLITYNLNIRQFAEDAIAGCEGPELLRAFYQAIANVTVLDPTCGSGAFLFAALNILEPLYEACLDRMQAFVEDLERSGERHSPRKFEDFRKVLAEVERHPNRAYFILKSIIVNNLYGVDIMEEAVEICKLWLFLKLVAQVDKVKDLEPLPDIDFNIRAGNTLVGFVSLEEIRRAAEREVSGQGRLVFGDTDKALRRIEEEAEIVERAFQKFHEMQTEHGMDARAFVTQKQELRQRLRRLAEELNCYLAGEYGVNPAKSKDFEKWRKSHQPFHWFAEFYGIMQSGGFDVIIGNPPYVEIRAVKTYKTLGYACEDAGNLYAEMLERACTLVNAVGRQGFIVPVSSISTDRYQPLQLILARSDLWYSSFDDRPSRLFDGLEHIRLTIHLIGAKHSSPQYLSTKYNKWNAVERSALFDQLVISPAKREIIASSFPKLCSTVELGILQRLSAQRKCLADFYDGRGRYNIFYSRKVGYFLQVLDFEPTVLDGKGRRRPPSEFKEIRFGNQSHAQLCLCCLNSNLFYWFITVFSDCRHVNKREVDAFPIALGALENSKARLKLEPLAQRLMSDIAANSVERVMKFTHDTLTVQCIIPKLSKPIVDEIDAALADYYGFSKEEIDFIINYDVKYRMGADDGGDE